MIMLCMNNILDNHTGIAPPQDSVVTSCSYVTSARLPNNFTGPVDGTLCEDCVRGVMSVNICVWFAWCAWRCAECYVVV